MKRRTLRTTLLRHWLSFAFLTGLVAILTAGIVAYAVEDRLIDQRLHETLAILTDEGRLPGDLSAGFTLYSATSVPTEVADALAGKKLGEAAEFRMGDGNYVHAVAAKRAGKPLFLVFDASETLVVQPIILVAASMALACLAIFVAIAALVANTLGRRVEKGSGRLLKELERCRTPRDVASLADSQDIAEIADFLGTHAKVWETRSQAVQEQEDTVTFLAHELRTPLQSARTSLAVLRDDVPASPALDRLDRAISRLSRASNAALFIGAEAELPEQTDHSLFNIWNELRMEFAPLAQKRDQYIKPAEGTDVRVLAPREAVEAVLSNLLGNAIGHGAPGIINLHGFDGAITISNPVKNESAPGFGMGLTIVQRLAAKLAWDVECGSDGGSFEARIRPGAAMRS